MRIGLITTSYPRTDGDAAGGFVAGHAAYLARTGARLDVIAAGDPSTPRATAAPSDAGPIAITRLPGPPGLFYAGGAPEALEADPGRLLGALGFSARVLAAAGRLAHRWDAVGAHWLIPAAIAAAVTTRRIPMLAIAHGSDVHVLAQAGLLAPTLALLRTRGARIVFVSDELRRRAFAAVPSWLAASIAPFTAVQPMGVDDRRFAAIAAARRARRRRSQAPMTLAVLARLVPIKGIEVAIAAVARARTPVRLIIAGDGPERARLGELAAPLGERVVFTGWLDGLERDQMLSTADVVVVPSAPRRDGRTEGSPLAAIEALAAGIPLIASDTGGLAELGRYGAHLVPPQDPAALAAAIDRMGDLRDLEEASVREADPVIDDRLPAPSFGWAAVGPLIDAHWRRVG